MSRPKKIDLALPDYVYPLGIRCRVQVATPEELDGNLGDSNADLRLIRVSDSQDTRRRWMTLYHEYVHVHFGLTGVDDAIRPKLEEIIVRIVETSFEAFLMEHGKQVMAALAAQSEEI